MGSIMDNDRDDHRKGLQVSQSYKATLYRIRVGMATEDDAGRVDALVRAAYQWGSEAERQKWVGGSGATFDEFLAWANQEG